MYAIRSYYAINATATKPYVGISQKEYEQADCIITQIIVETDEASKILGKPKGEYITIETKGIQGLDTEPDCLNEQVDMLAKELSRLSDAKGDVLVIGLGNDDITPDALVV